MCPDRTPVRSASPATNRAADGLVTAGGLVSDHVQRLEASSGWNASPITHARNRDS